MMKDFKDKTAIMTGLGSGTGAAVAIELAACGAHIVAADVDMAAFGGVACSIVEESGTNRFMAY